MTRSFIEVPPDSHFPLQNLPYGVFSRAGASERTVGVRLGDHVLELNGIPGWSGLQRATGVDVAGALALLYVDGAHRLISEYRFQDISQLNALMEMLERRVTMLGVLSAALSSRGTYVRIGNENPEPALHTLSLVAASYGLPQRNLGTVSVIGPTRMNYARAIQTVRAAAHELSRFVEELY